MKRIFTGITFSLTLALLCSCANHIKNTETFSQETERKSLGLRYHMTVFPEKLNDTSCQFLLEKQERAEVKTYEHHIVRNVVTPYSGWRELYEVPSGLFLLPVSLGAHLLFVVTIGVFPYDIPQAVNDLAFTGMNPCLNWESDTRREMVLAVADKKMLSETLVNERVPLSQQTVNIKAGDLSRNIKTDIFGYFTLHFLNIDKKNTFFPQARKITFTLPSDPVKSRNDIILSRDFYYRLVRARARIDAYFASPSGRSLSETVLTLEKMNFDRLAYELEERELNKRKTDHRFTKSFRDAIQDKGKGVN